VIGGSSFASAIGLATITCISTRRPCERRDPYHRRPLLEQVSTTGFLIERSRGMGRKSQVHVGYDGVIETGVAGFMGGSFAAVGISHPASFPAQGRDDVVMEFASDETTSSPRPP
jgi:hypothetical protein